MSLLLTLGKAAYRNAASRLRGFGLLEPKVDWAARATLCERCPMRVIDKKISYCGRPFLQQIDRDEALDGCGCPIRAKALDPAEHCPITPDHQARSVSGDCDCKWCTMERTARLAPNG